MRHLVVLGALSDLAVVVLMIALTGGIISQRPVHGAYPLAITGASDTPLVLTVTAVAWIAALAAQSTPGISVFTDGDRGMRKAAATGVMAFAGVALFCALSPDLALSPRSLVVVSVPAVALIAWRWLRNRLLDAHMRTTGFPDRILIVGTPDSCDDMAEILNRTPLPGRMIAGVCLSRDTAEPLRCGAPELGSVQDVPELVTRHGITTVLVAPSHGLTPEEIRLLSWDIEDRDCHMMMSLGMEEVTDRRVHVGGLNHSPFALITPASRRGPSRIAKRLLDIVVSALLLLALSPLLLVVALLIRLDSPGPVIFRQERVGLDGTVFTMLKFRTMTTDADQRREELLDAERDAGNAVLFKMTNDPRVTSVGAWLRRLSIDELPQLINTLRGDMSLVGPRPSLPSEVEMYETTAHRRFRVPPGITGLWQVSGRSSLSWEESIRLDLRYVDNWTFGHDISILLRTFHAVVSGAGAH